MPDWMNTPDMFLIGALGVIGLFLAATPILDARHKKREGQPGARLSLYREAMIMLWAMAIVAVLGWMLSGRPLQDIGFTQLHEGWRGMAALGLMVLALGYCGWQLGQMLVSSAARQSVRKQLEGVELGMVRAETRHEAWSFQALSATAGITEEIVFRGVLIAALALVIPLWAAAIISVIAFTLPHAYQGPAGMARVLPTGAFLTAIVLVGGSLWPAIIAHWVIDMTAGLTFAILDHSENKDQSEPDTPRDTVALEA